MNKKLLLVSLLAVGMLVGCGNGDGGSSVVPPSSEEPTTSVEQGGSSGWSNTYGNAGYYLIGTANNWDANFWTMENFEIFYFTPVGDGTYTLTGSVLAEDIPEGGIWEYKVRYFDGEGNIGDWYPDGVDNNGQITEAGQYKFTFNPESTEKAEKTNGSGELYTKFTNHEKLGEATEADRLKLSENQRPDLKSAMGTAKLNIVVDEGAVAEGQNLYVYGEFDGWTGWHKLESTDGKRYSVSFEDVVLGLGPLSKSYEFCLVLVNGEQDLENPDWSLQLKNPNASSGNWSATYFATKSSSSLQVSGTLHKYMAHKTPDEVIADMKTVAEDGGEFGYYHVTGEIIGWGQSKGFENGYNSNFDSWDILLKEETTGAIFEVYSANLLAGEKTPAIGDLISTYGIAKIYTPGEGDVVYELAYASSHKVSPIVYDVIAQVPYYVRGSMVPGGSWDYVPSYRFLETDTEGVYSFTIKLAVNDEFKVTDNAWTATMTFCGNGGNTAAGETPVVLASDVPAANFDLTGSNIKCLVAGDYLITIDTTGDADTCTISLAK